MISSNAESEIFLMIPTGGMLSVAFVFLLWENAAKMESRKMLV
jgi:hypothetical protein